MCIRMTKPYPIFRHGFTLVELLVAIAIIATLASLLFPALVRAKAASQQTVCLSNQKQIGLGMNLYLNDNEDTLPLDSHLGFANAWVNSLQPYVKSREILRCPMDKSGNFIRPVAGATKLRLSSYGTNYWMSQTSQVNPSPYTGFNTSSKWANPSHLVHLAEMATNRVSEHYHPPLWYEDNAEGVFLESTKELTTTIHSDRSNYIYADGHAKAVAFAALFSGDGRVDFFDPRRP
jgi:prepilin-type N-terminal cleavage/methylation domain-containing protein/prepilin-type processing-associated H-X9-DG protein